MFFFDSQYVNLLGIIITLLAIMSYKLKAVYAKCSKDMSSKIIIITGSSAGIGKETARDLLAKGATVIFACRDKSKTLSIIKNITNELNEKNAYFIELNLNNFKSVNLFVKEFSNKFNKLDILINNAGVMNEKLYITEDGLEDTLKTNHVSHMLLSSLLLKYFKYSEDPRIINLGSVIHHLAYDSEDYFSFEENKYKTMFSYSVSKAANIFFTEIIKKFSEEKLKENEIKSVCVHPGIVNSEITRVYGKNVFIRYLLNIFGKPLMYLIFKDEVMGAQTSLHVSYVDKSELVSGGYYCDCKLQMTSQKLKKDNLEKKIHEISLKAIKRSQVYQDNLNDEDFVKFLNFVESKI